MLKKKWKIISFIPLLLLYPFCIHQTDGFTLSKIRSNLSFHSSWTTQEPPQEAILSALKQPFHYLGHGAQTYAFSSLRVEGEEEYVLKFYRHDRATHPLYFLAPFIPEGLKKRLQSTILKRQTKKWRDFSSYILASNELQKETALLWVHLNPTPHLSNWVLLVDKLGIAHRVNLDEMSFILQKKASPFYPSLESWFANGEVEKVKNGVFSLIQLLKTRCQKQIFDKDPNVATNFGFIGNEAIQFDIGRFEKEHSIGEKEIYTKELFRITSPLRDWIRERLPSLEKELIDEIHR